MEVFVLPFGQDCVLFWSLDKLQYVCFMAINLK